ncbi:MAG: PLP-dependent aminotransferase family protein [Geminicoccaceae bacterium]|nr:PLP-dependent aminotransferase family protein [Geminicoccaceae bacterium]MDW8341748.1 PLP-dependent aminotransferase family protein [Geminicoccaceae bacterium]
MLRSPRRRCGPVHLASLALDPASPEPLYRQLYFAIREMILSGRLRPGARLPATRTLARDLGLSRNTVLAAFAQLHAEGYVAGRVGAGSFVSRVLPEEALQARRLSPPAPEKGSAPGPSARGRMLAALGRTSPGARPFAPGLPELAAFPFEDFARRLQRQWRAPPASFLIGADPMGWKPLREALAAHLGAARAVRCSADQVLVVSGAQQALDLAARVLLDPGDRVWIEDPGYAGLEGALLAAGAELVPVPVDEEGLSVVEGRRRAPSARMACVAPSHQFPLGVTMSLRRRLELLEWARTADAFVLEDDYDSEYRYTGRPLAALQGLDADGRVIYVGTMSKIMFPGLRLGYMVVPEHLVDAFVAVRRASDTHPPMLAQPALAEFIADGSLAQHIRRMRALYAERRARFLALVRELLEGWLEPRPSEAGMHLVGFLPEGIDDRAVSAQAARLGIEAPALSTFYRHEPARSGLVLGYAGVGESEMRSGLEKLARAIRAVAGAARRAA